ncbi:hypothetical protein HAHE_32680 [Haloferula helveola]|uniref:Uncharacterized protein n=1 Tax=Haloferula helveola TaxID=490095 RepID=A0ABM7RN94_9BACT|nr:hypothetical protein HAHE_32680 [Haloferula helveola]
MTSPFARAILASLALTAAAFANYTPSILNFTIDSGDFVIDSDASRGGVSYERDLIKVSANLSFTYTGSGPTSVNYRCDYQLLDANDNVILLNNGLGGTTTTYQGSTFTVNGSIGLSVNDEFQPAEKLESYQLYRVRMLLKKQNPPLIIYQTQTQEDTASKRLIHFTNTASGDAAVNVRGYIDSLEWTKRYACDTDPSNDKFTATATLKLFRYDAYLAASPSTDIVPHRITYELVDAGDQSVIAIAGNTTGPGYSLDQHDTAGSVEIPYERTVVREFNVNPNVQLDPVNTTYYVRAVLSHEEVPGDPYIDDTGTYGSLPSTLLHYNGTVIADNETDEIVITSLTNDPYTRGFTPTPGYIITIVTVGDSHIEGNEDFEVDWDTLEYFLFLYPDGTARYTSATDLTVIAPDDPDIGTSANVRFQRDDMYFDNDGLHGNVKVFLPAGMGAYAGDPTAPSNHVLQSILDTGARVFDQDLTPEATVIIINPPDPGDVWHIREETKPVEITANNILWNVNTGEFAPGTPVGGVDRARYVRRFEMDFLAAAPIPAAEKELFSNELYYNHLNPTPAALTTWNTDGNGVAQLDTTFAIDPGDFLTHFPYGAELSWTTQGSVEIDDDLVVPATSSLPDAGLVTMDWKRQCDDTCGTISNATTVLDPTVATAAFQFTRDGGLDVAGPYINLSSRRDLVMGYIDALSTSSNIYAHDTTTFDNGRFLMAGHAIDAADFSQTEDDGPGVLLNTGYDTADLNNPERPGDADYADGLGDYPGFNYRVADETAAPTAVSVLGGEPTPTYTLGSRSKYYTRLGGVSGIHEPASNPFTGPVMIYGYEFEFTSFGLSFLDSEVHDSITAGNVDIPSPSNFTLDFDPLYFNCLGGLTTAEIPGGSFDEDLDFWNADFTGISAHFQPAIGADCDPSEANLVVGVRTYASNIAPALAGSLGFHPDGNLITEQDARLEGIDSRLSLPSSIELAGPDGEIYNFFPTHDAYYENFEHSSSVVGQLSFPGLLDVPFFEDLEVHFQTGTTEANTTDTIHMMGGWPTDGVITAADFDTDNRSYPATTTLDAYRDLTDPDHRIHALQTWIGVVDFDYSLDWDTTTRSFSAYEPVENDLMVVTTEHELTYLSAENAEIDFGANLDLGFPEINLSNIAIDLVENTGVQSAIETAISENVTGALISGIDSSAELLNDRMDEFYDRIFDEAIEPIIDDLYTDMDAVTGFGATTARITLVEDYLCNNVDSVVDTLLAIDGAVGTAGSVIDEVDQALARLQIAIRTVIGRVEVSGGEVIISTGEITVPEEAVITAGGILTEGIFADTDGDGYDLAELLTAALIEELAPDIADSLSAVLTDIAGDLAAKLGDELTAQFEDAGPTIEQVKQVLLELHNTIQDVRDAGLLYSEISDVILAATSDIENAVTSAKDDITSFLDTTLWSEYTEEEVKEVIRLAIRDRFNASPAIASVQATLKAYIYDIDAAINEAISSAFGEVNKIIGRLLDDALPADGALAGMLDDVADISATANIDGYAHINGDALRTLRLDTDIQLKLPDDFEFAGYIEINQLDSDGDASCSFMGGEGEYAAEVKMGATDIPVGWGGEGLRFDVGTKFTFDTSSGFALRGFGGSFEMTQGEIGFESMAVTSLGAAAMFGKDENYLAAQVGLQFDSYELEGGIFFGRTCTVEPLELVDPDVTKVLGDPPFTGIYAYGEAQIPIVNASCFFNLSASAGAGVFWFEEGNTYGGKMTVGATGRALCAVGVGGDLTLVGSKSGNNYSFFGRGRVWGEVGKCPICTSFSEQVELTFKNNKWSYDF